MSNRRRSWVLPVLGAVVAVLAVVVLVTVLGRTGDDVDPTVDEAPVATEPTEPTEEPSATATAEPTPTEEPTTTEVVGVYYVGDGPQEAVLYREWQEVEVAEGAGQAGLLTAAAQAATSGTPLDPDYRSAWPAGDVVTDVAVEGGTVVVQLASTDVRDRPAGMDARDAELAVQQVMYTVQGVVQERAPVWFQVDGQPVDQVLGVPTAEPLAEAPLLETLSHMSISAPTEGEAVGPTFTASGASNGFEANVAWEVLDADGAVVAQGAGTAEGWMEEKLFPWELEVDLGDAAPGDYTFRACTDDPTGGTEGVGAFCDDKVVTVG